jgi:hypothetical protein
MKQDNCSPSKANSSIKDPDTCIEEKLSNNEFQKTIIKLMNDFKEETQNLVFDIKENMNK